MTQFKGHFISIIFIGRQNPQILTPAFLMDNDVIPKTREPFKTILADKGSNPFTEFISTPVLTTLKYSNISIMVEENRYQIQDNKFDDLISSPIIQITKNYFGKILRYTPLKVGGINFNGSIEFNDEKDEHSFDERLGIGRDKLSTFTGTSEIKYGMSFSYPYSNGLIEVQLPKPKIPNLRQCAVNFNYEFKYVDIDSFTSNLDNIPSLYGKFNELLRFLGVK